MRAAAYEQASTLPSRPRPRVVEAGGPLARRSEALAPAWSIETGSNVTGAPLVDGGVVYAADWGGEVLAVDAERGAVLWKRSIQTPNEAWPWHGFAGTGALDAKQLYEASVEGEAYALDRGTGELRWRHRFATHPNAGNVGRLLARGGRLFVGLSSVEEGLSTQPGFTPSFVGEVVALATDDGRELWRRPLTEPPHTGVAVWSGFSLDEASGTLFFTTGNDYTGEASALSDALVAVDAGTGAIRWSRQVTAGDVWTMAAPIGPDFDFGAPPQLFDATLDGRVRRLVGAGQKSGIYFAWDRDDGELAWQTSLGEGGTGGGIIAEAAIRDGVLFLWSNDGFAYRDPEDHPLRVAAIDAASGAIRWEISHAQPAAATTAGVVLGEVYYVPSYDGRLRGYRTSDGSLAWTSDGQPHLASIGSSLATDGERVYLGTGIPAALGGSEGDRGLFAFRPLGARP